MLFICVCLCICVIAVTSNIYVSGVVLGKNSVVSDSPTGSGSGVVVSTVKESVVECICCMEWEI